MDEAASNAVGEAGVATVPPEPAQLKAIKQLVDSTYRETTRQPQGAAQPTSSWWSNQDAMTISAAVLIFGAIVIALATFTARRASASEALRLYATIMVITMASFLVVAGYDNNQIAAPLGLLGTIAGYLLGKPSQPPAPPKPGGERSGDDDGDGRA